MAAEFARRLGPPGKTGGGTAVGGGTAAVGGTAVRGGTAAGSTRRGPVDGGSAIVEFVLVTTLLLILFLGIVQTGIVLHVRNTLAADAAEGARHAANLGVTESAGGDYAERLISQSLPGQAAVSCDGVPDAATDGTLLVKVTCQVEVPLALTLVGGSVDVTVTGRAIKEQP